MTRITDLDGNYQLPEVSSSLGVTLMSQSHDVLQRLPSACEMRCNNRFFAKVIKILCIEKEGIIVLEPFTVVTKCDKMSNFWPEFSAMHP